jgi:heme/copper-type cytochrome/quinol oxidase subunit 3
MKLTEIQKHPFHLVDPSPWPIVSASACGITAIGAALYMHAFMYGDLILLIGILSVICCMIIWWRDVIREATYNGYHTKIVQRGLRSGMLLFILSEVMFFLAFFWAFFHSSLSPAIEIGSVWPPVDITPFDPWGVPLLNTLILLLSGATVTWAHHEILAGRKEPSKQALILTVLLALLFTGLQVYEYIEASFTISDGIYGSTFFMATGFHGFHVIIGTIFLTVCYLRLVKNHFTKSHHFGFEAAAWYWHFVDVVWLFLFVNVYWWGNSI